MACGLMPTSLFASSLFLYVICHHLFLYVICHHLFLFICFYSTVSIRANNNSESLGANATHKERPCRNQHHTTVNICTPARHHLDLSWTSLIKGPDVLSTLQYHTGNSSHTQLHTDQAIWPC